MTLPLFALAAALAAGDAMPALTGEYLTGKRATLPQAAAGKVALVAMGFTYKSRHDVEAWVGQFRQDFGAEPRATFYEVPLIGGLARAGKWFIDSGMRRGTPQTLHENVITIYGGVGPWKERMGVKNDELSYLLLLDRNGRIAWRGSGPFSPEAYQALAARIREALAN